MTTMQDERQRLDGKRLAFAQALQRSAPVRDPRVVAAFAQVPRERFLAPPPWTLLGLHGRRTSDDPAELYDDLLVEIDRERGINNGEPSLWAFLFDRAKVQPGERVLHVGTGGGYYTAILAELVGGGGHVTGVEIEADLAAHARGALTGWPQVEVVEADAAFFDPGEVDLVVTSAGATHPAPVWLDRLREGGRIVMALTDERGHGAFFRLTRDGERFAAACLCGTAIYPLHGLRHRHSAWLLERAIAEDADGMWAVNALHRGEPADSARVWYAGPVFWLEKGSTSR